MKYLLSLLFILAFAVSEAQENKFVFVFLHKRADLPQISKEESDKIMEGHMANINRLAKEGKLIAAGPFDGGGGIFIFASSSVETVKEWVSTDPGVKAKRWNIEYLPYYPLIGGVCAVTEPYEMTSYTFLQFKPKVFKFNVQDGMETVEKHNKFISSLPNVITHGSFGQLDGSVVVINGAVDEAEIFKDPSVSGALFEPEFKKLYIAKGAFCEK